MSLTDINLNAEQGWDFSLERRRLLLSSGLSLCLPAAAFGSTGSDVSRVIDTVLTDPATHRKIAIRIRLPAEKNPTAFILYSPGLGSGISNGQAWCDAWQKAGWLVVTLSHPVSNESIWDISRQNFRANLNDALAAVQYGLRVKDCSFVLSHCLDHPDLRQYIDPARIGIAGHSYGALTVQSAVGQSLGAKDVRDVRIRAAIAFSPGAVSVERARAMSSVTVPFFSVTGDHDQFVTFKKSGISMKLGMALNNRLLIQEYLPAGQKQVVILNQTDHMTFAGEPLDPERFSRDVPVSDAENLQAWSRINDMTTAFWRFYLSASPSADAAVRIKYQKQMLLFQTPGDELRFG